MSEYVDLRYVSSRGEVFHFQESSIVKTKTANFHEYMWSPQTFDLLYGANVTRIKKDPLIYQTELRVKGSKADRIAFLEAFHLAADIDIVSRTVGRLYWKDMYIECYAVSSSTYPSDNGYSTVNDVEFFCPYPSWIYPRTYARTSHTAAEVAAIMGVDESTVVLSDGVYNVPFAGLPSNFRLRAQIAENFIEEDMTFLIKTASSTTTIITTIINRLVDDGLFIMIDGKTKEASLLMANGQEYEANNSALDYLSSDTDYMKKIEPFTTDGIQVVKPTGANVDAMLTVWFERSEPLWI